MTFSSMSACPGAHALPSVPPARARDPRSVLHGPPAVIGALAARCRYPLAVFAAGFALSCSAQTGVAVQGGKFDGVSSLGVQVAFGEFMTIERGGWRLVGYPELQLNVHRDDGDDLVQTGVFATFRAAPARVGLRPYVEAGLGANLLSRTELGSDSYSTSFQFGEHVGVGFVWGSSASGGADTTWAGLRFTHYSNASIKNPNDGLESLQLVVGHRF